MPESIHPPTGDAPLDRVAGLFEEAIAIGSPTGRQAFVAALRVREPALADELLALLDAHFGDPAFLAGDLVHEVADIMSGHLETERIGTRIGAWAIDGVLHRGGMGTVYRAHRVAVDFDQQAALKVIRAGHHTPALIRRFAQERQLLARFEHPNIARLLDGGTTADGLPYLVMEYVRGEMIDRWCERVRPPLDHLFAVFAQICTAVHVAHQHLVVHQDIKPANILVTEDGTAKLLDFGIADLERQATSGDGNPEDGPTDRMLTPDYASPEQFRGEAPGTATDTWSLGVLLYRLLTGDLPLPVHDAPSLAEAQRMVCDTVPQPPSVGMAAAGIPLPPRAADLDAIILRALHKNPADRYPSVLAFAEDLHRYSIGLPVQARTPTLRYRAARFVARHWAGVAAAATIVLLLVGGLSVALWQAGIAQRERDTARAEATTAASAVEFLKTVLGSGDPWRDAEPVETVDDVIQLAEVKLDSVLGDEPAVRAYILAALGEVAAGRGELERADRLTGAAVAVLDQEIDGVSSQGAAIHLARALALHELGSLPEAHAFAAEAVRQLDARRSESHTELIGALNQLGAIDIDIGDHAAAEATLRRAIAVHRTSGTRETLGLAGVYNNLAVAVAGQPDRLNEVVDLFAEAARIVESLGASAPRLATQYANQANTLRLLGRHAEAETIFHRAITLLTGSLGADHPSTLTAATSLASLYETTGQFAKAAATLDGPLASARTTLSSDHPVTAYIQNVLGSSLCQMGGGDNLTRGLALSRASLAARRAGLSDEHWAVASGEAIVGYCLLRLGQRTEAVALLERAHRVLQAQRGADNDLTVRTRRWLEEAGQ